MTKTAALFSLFAIYAFGEIPGMKVDATQIFLHKNNYMRCTVSPEELALALEVPDWGTLVYVELAVGLSINYETRIDPTAQEIDRCVAEIYNSASTQEYLRRWVASDIKARVKRQWEIRVNGKLVTFLGVPLKP